MRIAIVTPGVLPCPPRRYGGLEAVCWDLACGLARKHDVMLIAPQGSKEPPGGELIQTVKAEEKVQVDWLAKERDAYEIYRNFLREVEIIHSATWFGHPYLYKMEHPESRVLHTFHGWPSWESPPPVEYPNFCAISKFMALGVENHFGGRFRVRTLYNPVDPEKYPLYKGPREDYLLFISRISRIKAPHWAIRVAKMAELPLVIAGGEFVEDPNYVKSIKAMCDGEQIIWKGEVTHEEKVELMQRARAVLCLSAIPGFPEPLGLISLESQLCGTIPLCLNNGAWFETIEHGETGFLCRSLEEMAEYAKRIENSPGTAFKCRKWVEKHFGIDVIVKEHEKAYQDILDGNEW